VSGWSYIASSLRARAVARLAALAGAITAIGLAGVSAATAAGCSDTWKTAGSGLWSDASNWTAGVPTSSSDVCLPDTGTSYVVTATDSPVANSVTLGATTLGNSAAGTVRGTEWLTVDYCEGTSVRVTRGAVLVTDLRRHRSKLVRAGHSIFVAA
jgi:hypothetical protein